MRLVFSRLAFLLSLLALLPCNRPGAAAAPVEPLATAAEVLSLTAPEAGSRMRVSVTGVVTAAEPDWSGQFFVQDSTGGVFVENLRSPTPNPGDIVRVTGVSHPGAFAPIISEPRWEKTGVGPLPDARQVPIENLESGSEDGQRVEITGVVRRVRVEFSRLDLDVAVGGYRLQVRAPLPTGESPESLIASRVRVRGTAATHYNAALRHLTAVAVYVPRAADFAVLEREAVDPFAQPVIPSEALARYRRHTRAAQRVHVRGTVTLVRQGGNIFLQDESGGIRLETNDASEMQAGATIEAAGFLEFEEHLPVLRDATLRRAGAAAAAPIRPALVSTAELLAGKHHAELVTLRAKILDRSVRPATRPPAAALSITTWLAQGDGLSFPVECETGADDHRLSDVPLGSTVELDGVCVLSVEADGKLKSLQVLLPSPADVRLLTRPSWLTPKRLLIGLTVLSLVLLAVASWSLTVSRKNAALRAALLELEKAQRELQEAHDTLEAKVAERSAQLQVEMTARRAAELEFKAVLAERTRLARDLHDTLEQTLTGIALQLDTAAKLFDGKPAASQHHLQLARNWLHQSQVELRRSIWDLRSRELERFDVANALKQSIEHLVDSTGITLEFSTSGTQRRLPEVVEENLLRIGQEAVTNVVKHAKAQRLRVTLAFATESLRLRVEDDGIGFDSPATPAPNDDHFGLLGMSERSKRLGGCLAIDSRRGRGTLLTVDIPLEPAERVSPPANNATAPVI